MSGPRHQRRDRGAVIPVVAMLLTTLVLMTAFAVDLGRQRSDRRSMQAVADVIALDMARLANGRTIDQINAGIDYDQNAEDAIVASANRNGVARAQLTLDWGNVDPTTGDYTSLHLDPNGVPDAAMITAEDTTDYSFQPGSGDVVREAVAAHGEHQQARFRVGSSLVAINPATSSIIGQLLNDIIPGASALSYEGLANADIDLDLLGQQLGIPITAASPQELLDTEVSMDDLVVASMEALRENDPDAAGIEVLEDLVALGVSPVLVSLGEVLGVTAGGGSPTAASEVNIAQLLTASAFLVNGEHFVTVPSAAIGLPAIGDVGIRLTGIEAPREGGNEDGASVSTSQVNLEVTPEIAIDTAGATQQLCTYPSSERNLLNSLIGGLLNIVGCLLNPLSAAAPLSVQISGTPTIEAEVAEVTVTQSIDCVNRELTLIPTPSAVRLLADIGLDITAVLAGTPIDIADFHLPAGLIATGSAPPTTFAAIEPTPPPADGILTEFDPPQARVGSDPLGLGGIVQVGPGTLTVLNTDLSTLNGVVLALVEPLINDLLGQLDTLLLQPLAQLLGIHLGGADLTPLWMDCDSTAVQLVG